MTTSRADTLHPDALAAIARTRADGLHFWGRMLGVSTVPVTEGTTLLRATGGTDVTTLATLADVCLGYAVRASLGNGHRLATSSLSLQRVALPAAGAITCGSRLVWTGSHGRRALVEAYAEDAAGTLVATARAWMVVLPVAPGSTVVPMPWERDGAAEPVEVLQDSLTDIELEVTTTATAAIERAAISGLPLAEELLEVTWTADGTGRVVGTLTAGAHLGNRVGNMQGGATYGLAAIAATRAAALGDGPEQHLADGSLQFLRAIAGGELRVTATVLRRGRSVTFVDVVIERDDATVASAHFSFMA
ncbi:PaaI family thioesterase [Nocardioides sp. Iso805N]|uniref:PaaI family thioesterase n=1 Tax=Nocardioides sp. Iso805N TaxID=1283287 RepID=UPI00037AB026|nr:PaaI family thioesterase [Nocardioides sp. Iso805N]